MNKKFSTLMASVLLASAFSTAAYAQGVDKDLKGKVIALYTNSAASPLAVNEDGTLEKNDSPFATGWNTNAFSTANRALWKVADVKFDQTTGAGIYQFVNKQTGAYLAIDLKTDNTSGTSTNPVKLNGAGNKKWSITDGGVIYAYANDSIYTLTDEVKPKLKATPGNAVPGDGLKIYGAVPTDANAEMEMTGAAFNAMLAQSASDGKLHFNGGKDVSSGEQNILTENKWFAYEEQDNAKKFFISVKGKETSVGNPYLLMVDKEQYAASMDSYFKLTTDTLSIVGNDVKNLKGTNKYKASNYAPTNVDKYVRPINAATFSAKYYYAKDSVVISVAGVPQKTAAGYYVIVNAKNAYSDLKNSGDLTPTASTIPGYSSITASTSGNAVEQLKYCVDSWLAVADDATPNNSAYNAKFSESKCLPTAGLDGAGKKAGASDGVIGLAKAYVNTAASNATQAEKDFVDAVASLERKTTTGGKYYEAGLPTPAASATPNYVALTSLSSTKVLTVAPDLTTYIKPLVQPFTTTGGDAVIAAGAKLYTLQVKNTANDMLRATAQNDKYLVSYTDKAEIAETADAANVYAQWAFVSGETGYYQIINRGSQYELYTGPVSKVKDAAGNVVADTYVLGADTVKLAAVTLSTNEFEDKEGDKTVKYDYSGYFYAGPTKDKSYSFAIAPASQFMTNLGAQFNKDSVMVLGASDEAPVWYFEENKAATYGLEIEGLTPLKYMTYKVYTKNANGDKLYVWATDAKKYNVTNEGHVPAVFKFREINKGQYLIVETTSATDLTDANKMTINPTPAQPVLEVTAITSAMRDDYFVIASASSNDYRTLTAEDGVNGNVKIFMNNEPYRYLYENTANIVANNGNKIAKDSLNFLGIFNAAASSKNAALYVDTAYVNRKGVTMPQYMFALGVEDHEATPAAPCTESGVHVDKDGKATTADKCVHATPATKAYKSGRYLVSVADSASTAKHPAKYDGAFRLAFVEAIHVEGSDSLIIVNSKYTNNTNVITEGKATTYASKDTLKFENDKPNVATFALLIKDQADKSFYLETANKTYVRILNGVPVLTEDKENAAIFNIEATTEEATANEAIEAAGIQVIGGKGAVTVQGAAGKVITVANVLGQTIANQVAASDNVTIAAPAGIVVVAVEGEATKVVVK